MFPHNTSIPRHSADDQIISTNPDNLFQSDKDLEKSHQRALKQKNNLGHPIQLSSKLLHFVISPDGNYFYTGESAFISRQIEVSSGNTSKLFKGHEGPITKVGLCELLVSSKGGQGDAREFLLTSSWDKTLKKWDLQTGDLVTTYVGHSDFVKSFTNTQTHLYSSSSDSTIRIWPLNPTTNVTKTESIAMIKGHRRAVEDLVIHENYLYSSSSDGDIRKWDLSTRACVAVLKGHLTCVYQIIIDDGMLWSTSADKTAKRWDVDTLKPDTTFTHKDFVKSCAVASGYLITGSRDENVRVWDLSREKCVHIFKGHWDEVSGVVVRGGTVWTCSLDGTIRRWELKDVGSAEHELEEEDERPNTISQMTAEEEAELAELM